MEFSAAWLSSTLAACIPRDACGLLVAISGGLDSMCLLTALSQARGANAATAAAAAVALPIRAVHVDHGLQPAAAQFRTACAALCARLDIPLEILAATVDSSDGVSIEAAARDARYQALALQLRAGECLLTAHHQTDQAETLLLQLLRGAGLKGLAAMPARRRFGAGWHVRPLLDVPGVALRRFAEREQLAATTDPMNLDMRFDRAYLRSQLWPLIEARWPGATAAVARTARHAAEAQSLLNESAALDLETLRDGEGLSVPRLRLLAPARRRNALRCWIEGRGALPPPAARLAEALRQIADADDHHLPAVLWGAHALRRYRDRVLLTPATVPQLQERHEWRSGLGELLQLGDGLGSLHVVAQRGGLDAARLPPQLGVRGRVGGASLRPSSRASTQRVQHLCQALGVLPWMRDALPFVYAGDALVAVGDLWLDARWCVPAGAMGLGFAWHGAPSVI